MAAIINGVVLSKENIAFLKAAQEKARAERIAKVKNFQPADRETILAATVEKAREKKAKTKISHAARRARRVALSIAADPRNKGTSKGK